ncbi:MAG TPA: hypothetical protein VFP89_02315 [Propionibacteriaceae bacterium]|nr:hypothetical protein [Propionibacteriaceae bacterium]
MEQGSSQALVLGKVCVRKLPPDPQGNRTRISWDPWSVEADTRAVKARLRGASPAGMFPKEETYRVGQCAQGWIPFPTSDELDRITYANGLGDTAVWDPDHLDAGPVVSKAKPRQPQQPGSGPGIGEGTFIVGDDIRPGRYKARAASGDSCYWARLKDDSGDFDSIIANNVTSGSASVTIKPSDGAFETRGCTPWIRQ